MKSHENGTYVKLHSKHIYTLDFIPSDYDVFLHGKFDSLRLFGYNF